MNANEYLQSSTLYRKLIHGPYGKFARVYAGRLSDEGFGRQCTWRSLSLFRELMDWHVGNGHDPQDLSEVHVDRFLEHRFKHWSPDSGVSAIFVARCRPHFDGWPSYRGDAGPFRQRRL